MIFRSDINVDVIRHLGNDQFVIGAMKTLKDIPEPIREGKLSDRGRIRYLMEHRHGTPFEHNCFILNVHAPIFVWREWHRHRIGFSYNEESARYKQLEPIFFIPRRDRKMVKTPGDWRPGRPKFMTLDEEVMCNHQITQAVPGEYPDWVQKQADDKYAEIVTDMKAGHTDEYERYERQLNRNLDPGLARDNLPVGIYSMCWVTCNLRSALAFLSLRTHEPAAKFVSYPLAEIEEGARKLEQVVAENYPICYEAFNDFGRVGP